MNRETVLLAVHVGLPRQLGAEGASEPMERLWTTGFIKEPVAGPVRLGVTNLEGDGQADLVHHGGPDKAVLAYAAEHYDAWRQELALPDLPLAAFGENFTIAGQSEASVCIGDVWQVGDTLLQVSQPRQPCWKLARRWRIKTLALRVQETGRTGWYLRVLQVGIVEAGMPLELRERPHATWTVQRANQIMHVDKSDLRLAGELAELPELAPNWKATLRRRVEQNLHPDPDKRLIGPNAS
jgi:MOSC domain-containing protein YiiM